MVIVVIASFIVFISAVAVMFCTITDSPRLVVTSDDAMTKGSDRGDNATAVVPSAVT